MDKQNWTASETDLLAIRFLDWVAESDSSTTTPPAIEFYGKRKALTPVHSSALEAVVQDLKSRGLIDGQRMLAGWVAFHARLTPEGRSLVGDRKAGRASRRARSVTARDALLDWMYENTSDYGESPEFEHFGGSPQAHFEADPFTNAEIMSAAKHLRDEEYAKGIAGSEAVLLRPSVTTKGRRAVESGRYTAESAESGGTINTVNVSGGNYGQVGTGHTVTQTQTNGIDPATLFDLVAAVREQLEGLPEHDVSGAEAYLTMIEAAGASDEPNRGVLEIAGRGLLSLGDKATTAFTGASIRALWAYLADRYGFPTA